MEDADNAVGVHCQVNEQSNEQSTAMEGRVRVTSNVGPDVVKVSASSREVGSVSPLVPRPRHWTPIFGSGPVPDHAYFVYVLRCLLDCNNVREKTTTCDHIGRHAASVNEN